MTANSMKLENVELVLAIGNAITVWVRPDYLLCSFLMVNGNPMNTDKVKTEDSRTAS